MKSSQHWLQLKIQLKFTTLGVMDINLAKRKQEQLRRQQQLKRKIKEETQARMNESVENFAKNKEVIGALNQELITLKMEFELEELGVKPKTLQKRAAKSKQYFCNCFLMSPTQQQTIDCDNESLTKWMRVKDEQDFRDKYFQVMQMDNNLQYCSEDCFHIVPKHIYDVCSWCRTFQGRIACCCVFFWFQSWVFICCLCPLLGYSCCMKITDGCYKKDNRFRKIRECYDKYIKYTSVRIDV